MSAWTWIALILVFFLTSVIGVVTGSNSLITVPWMFQLGVPERQAVATNMFGLLFMSIGASIPFVRRGTVELRSLVPASVLTAIGSTIGALITGWVSDGSVRVIVPTAMIAIAIFLVACAMRFHSDPDFVQEQLEWLVRAHDAEVDEGLRPDQLNSANDD